LDHRIWRNYDARKKDRTAIELQVAATRLAARQSFNSKHLELCTEAAGDAGTIAKTEDTNKKRSATDNFWRLYWGPLAIVEETEVAQAMVAFGQCLDGRCNGSSLTNLAINIAHACRAEVSRDFDIKLSESVNRPPPK
jgi:hypothetical protein